MIDINLIPAALRKDGKGKREFLDDQYPQGNSFRRGVGIDFAYGDGPSDFGGGMVDRAWAVCQL